MFLCILIIIKACFVTKLVSNKLLNPVLLCCCYFCSRMGECSLPWHSISLTPGKAYEGLPPGAVPGKPGTTDPRLQLPTSLCYQEMELLNTK